MTTNILNLMERHLSVTMQGGFSSIIKLKDPDGNEFESLGQVVLNTQKFNPDTGETIVVNNPVAVIRNSDVSRVPKNNEKWLVNIPITPTENAERRDYMLSGDRAPESVNIIGFTRLYLKVVKQS